MADLRRAVLTKKATKGPRGRSLSLSASPSQQLAKWSQSVKSVKSTFEHELQVNDEGSVCPTKQRLRRTQSLNYLYSWDIEVCPTFERVVVEPRGAKTPGVSRMKISPKKRDAKRLSVDMVKKLRSEQSMKVLFNPREQDQWTRLVRSVLDPMKDREIERKDTNSIVLMMKAAGGMIVMKGGIADIIDSVVEPRSARAMVSDFLATYRYYLDDLAFVVLLIKRYFNPPRPDGDQEEFENKAADVERITRVRSRVLEVIRQWLSEQVHLIRKSPDVITLLRAFVEKILKRNKMMNAAEMIDALLEEKEIDRSGMVKCKYGGGEERWLSYDEIGQRLTSNRNLFADCIPAQNAMTILKVQFGIDSIQEAGRVINELLELGYCNLEQKTMDGVGTRLYYTYQGFNSTTLPKPLISKEQQQSQELDPFQVHPIELARQLCLIEQEFASKICPWTDFVGVAKAVPEQVTRWVDWTNRLSNWVASEVVSSGNLKLRVALIRRLYEVAKECQNLKNFSSMLAIVGGMQMPEVARLKATWEQVPRATLKLKEDLEELISPLNNFRNLRHVLLESQPPLLPSFPVILKDITQTELGNDTFDDNNAVNFDKMRLLAQEFRRFEAYHQFSYPLQRVYSICDRLLAIEPLSSEEIQRLSREIQPRAGGHVRKASMPDVKGLDLVAAEQKDVEKKKRDDKKTRDKRKEQDKPKDKDKRKEKKSKDKKKKEKRKTIATEGAMWSRMPNMPQPTVDQRTYISVGGGSPAGARLHATPDLPKSSTDSKVANLSAINSGMMERNTQLVAENHRLRAEVLQLQAALIQHQEGALVFVALLLYVYMHTDYFAGPPKTSEKEKRSTKKRRQKDKDKETPSEKEKEKDEKDQEEKEKEKEKEREKEKEEREKRREKKRAYKRNAFTLNPAKLSRRFSEAERPERPLKAVDDSLARTISPPKATLPLPSVQHSPNTQRKFVTELASSGGRPRRVSSPVAASAQPKPDEPVPTTAEIKLAGDSGQFVARPRREDPGGVIAKRGSVIALKQKFEQVSSSPPDSPGTSKRKPQSHIGFRTNKKPLATITVGEGGDVVMERASVNRPASAAALPMPVRHRKDGEERVVHDE